MVVSFNRNLRKQQKFGSNDKPGLTLTYFTAGSNFGTYAFTWENVAMMDSLEIITSCGLDFGL